MYFLVFPEGVADQDSAGSRRYLRRRPTESAACQPGRVSGVFAVPGRGSERPSAVGQVRRAAGAALAVRRHRAGRGRGGVPRRTVPGERVSRRRKRPPGRIRRPGRHQLTGRLSRVHIRHDGQRSELDDGAAQRIVVRPRNRLGSGTTDGRTGRSQRGPARGRRDCVPRWQRRA